MPLFGNGVALRLALEANEKANAVNAMLATAIAEFRAHSASCDASARAMREEMQRDHNGQQEWRRGLGERLDAQDRMMTRVAFMVIGVLCSIIVSGLGFLLSHLVSFK